MKKNHINNPTWGCKYHIVFAPKFSKKVTYEDILVKIRKYWEDYTSRGLSRPHSYLWKDTNEHEYLSICRISQRKKPIVDFWATCQYKLQIWKSTICVHRVFVDTTGKSDKAIAEYIKNQLN